MHGNGRSQASRPSAFWIFLERPRCIDRTIARASKSGICLMVERCCCTLQGRVSELVKYFGVRITNKAAVSDDTQSAASHPCEVDAAYIAQEHSPDRGGMATTCDSEIYLSRHTASIWLTRGHRQCVPIKLMRAPMRKRTDASRLSIDSVDEGDETETRTGNAVSPIRGFNQRVQHHGLVDPRMQDTCRRQSKQTHCA